MVRFSYKNFVKIGEREFPLVHLQSYGEQPGIPAREVQTGDIQMYNFGGRGRIVSKAQKGRFINFEVESQGKIYPVRRREDVTIPISNETLSSRFGFDPKRAYPRRTQMR